MDQLPQRKHLNHAVPAWVESATVFFITINSALRGENTLVQEITARALIESAKHYHVFGNWWIGLFLIMPDHLHALMAVPSDRQLKRTITAWKSYQTKHLGVKWQACFFDHRLRNSDSAEQKAHYIRMNPVRAGLVTKPKDWPHVWHPDKAS